MFTSLKRKKTDEILQQIRSGNKEILIHLFERNFVTAKNRGKTRGMKDKAIVENLAAAVVNYWKEITSSRENLEPDDRILTHFANKPAETKKLPPSIKSSLKFLTYISASCKELLQLTLFEKFPSDIIKKLTGFEEPGNFELKFVSCKNKLESIFYKNQKGLGMEKRELDKNTELLIEKFLRGNLTREEELELEVKLSLDKDLKKQIEIKELLNESIRISRERELQEYVIRNSSTRLTGNFWSIGWTSFSAIVVILTGILIFFFDDPTRFNSNDQDELLIPAGSELIKEDIFPVKNYYKRMRVKFYDSPSSDFFYSFEEEQLYLFDVAPPKELEIIKIDRNFYLHLGNDFFHIRDDNGIKPAEKVTDIELLKRLQ